MYCQVHDSSMVGLVSFVVSFEDCVAGHHYGPVSPWQVSPSVVHAVSSSLRNFVVRVGG